MGDLLKQRIKEFEIPDAAMNRYPLWDKVIVWRIDTRQEKTAGGLYVPDQAQDAISHRGVLLRAGLAALDRLYSYGVEMGHIVHFGRYSGQDETVVKRAAGTADDLRIVVLSCAEVTSSEDLAIILVNGALSVRRGENGEHYIDERERIDGSTKEMS